MISTFSTIEKSIAHLISRNKRRRRRGANGHNIGSFLQGAVRALRLNHVEARPFSIVQIGANDGITVDPVHPFAREFRDSSLLLIEPQPDICDLLKENYKVFPNVKFGNFAIGAPGEIKLWRIKPEIQSKYKGVIGSGITSFDKKYVEHQAYKKIPRQIIVEYRSRGAGIIESFTVPCLSLEQAFIKTGSEKIVDWLQIDTEGYDDNVIYYSSVDKFKPSIISYESAHLSADKLNRLKKYLKLNGYAVYEPSGDESVAILSKDYK